MFFINNGKNSIDILTFNNLSQFLTLSSKDSNNVITVVKNDKDNGNSCGNSGNDGNSGNSGNNGNGNDKDKTNNGKLKKMLSKKKPVYLLLNFRN